jgi:hypothetical protein
MRKNREIELSVLVEMVRRNAELPFRTKFGTTHVEITAVGAVANGSYVAFMGEGEYIPFTIKKPLLGKDLVLLDGCGAVIRWSSVPTEKELEEYNWIFKTRPEYKILAVREI